MSNPHLNPAPIYLSLATAPFLVGLLAVQCLLDELVKLGEASEEVFRGTRLPVLSFPTEATEEEEPTENFQFRTADNL